MTNRYYRILTAGSEQGLYDLAFENADYPWTILQNTIREFESLDSSSQFEGVGGLQIDTRGWVALAYIDA